MEGANVIASETRVQGRVHGEGSLHVDGQVDGSIEVGGTLHVRPTGAVHGEVHGQDVLLQGDQVGDVQADGSLTIEAGATVQGSLSAPVITVSPQASVSGNFQMALDLPRGLSTGPGRRR